MSKRKCLKHRRAERPVKPTKRQRKHDAMMQTLDGRLLLCCKLVGITPEVTEQYVCCTMPSEVILTIYKKPMRLVSYNSMTLYGSIYYPNRKLCNPEYLSERMAHHLFNKLGEKIDEIENGKPSVSEPSQEPQAATTPEQRPDDTPQVAEAKTQNILTRFVQSMFWWKNTYQRNKED